MFVIFQGGGGVRTLCPPLELSTPMALASVINNAYLLFVVAPIVKEFCVGALYLEVFYNVLYRCSTI